MSGEQGPRFAGMRPTAIADGRRQWPNSLNEKRTEAST